MGMSVTIRLVTCSRMVVEDELGKLKRFREFLRSGDEEIFDDLLNQCWVCALLDMVDISVSETSVSDTTCDNQSRLP